MKGLHTVTENQEVQKNGTDYGCVPKAVFAADNFVVIHHPGHQFWASIGTYQYEPSTWQLYEVSWVTENSFCIIERHSSEQPGKDWRRVKQLLCDAAVLGSIRAKADAVESMTDKLTKVTEELVGYSELEDKTI
jgi:hypothetical protein